MEMVTGVAPAPKPPPPQPQKNTARKVPSKTPKPGAKAARATRIDLQPMNDPDVEEAASDEEDAEKSTQTTGQSWSSIFHFVVPLTALGLQKMPSETLARHSLTY